MEITPEIFNKIPNIDTSGSDAFKKQALQNLNKNVSNWRDFINLEYNMDLEEDDPYNQIAGSGVLASISPFMYEQAFRNISLPKNVLNHILILFFKKTMIYTNLDLVNQIKKACNYLNQQGIKEYTAIVEYGEIGKKYKSKDWIFHEAMNYLEVSPSCVQNYNFIKKDGTFVIMDDGIYSGTQITSIIAGIFRKTTNCVIYVLSMFSAKVGLDLLERVLKFDSKIENENEIIYKKGGYTLYLWKGYILIPTITEVLTKMFIDNKIKYDFKVIDQISHSILNKAASNIIFEHKIPDYKSFPSILHNFFYITMFDHFSKTPPYALRKQFEKVSDYHFKCDFGSNGEISYLKSLI